MVNWNPVGSRYRMVDGRWVPVSAQYRRDGGAWVPVTTHYRNVDGTPPPPPPPPTGGPAGLTVGAVLAGWYAAAPDASGNNDWAHASVIMDARNTSTGGSAWWQGSSDHAKTLPGGLTHKYPSITKQFFKSQITNAQLLANLATADLRGWFLCQTTKVVKGDWAGVAAGNYDDILAGYAQIALDRIAKKKPPFALTYHHEPYGDSTATQTYADWGAMQIHCSYFMAGWRKSTDSSKGALPTDADAVYHADLDTRAGLSWICIPNGWLFTKYIAGAIQPDPVLDTLMPADLITAFNANNGIVSPDVYDEPTSGKRTHDKINAIYNWCSTRGALYAGVTEMGCLDDVEMTATWTALKNHKDLFLYAIYWDSGNGPESQITVGGVKVFPDWRLIPNGYPADSLAGGTGPVVTAGSAASQLRLIYWRDTAVPESERM